MSVVGNYLYGFTDSRFRPAADLCGLAGARVETLPFGDVAALVSRHAVQPLMPVRTNLEPHHRVVRRVSAETALVPAAFGHISATDDELLSVLRANHDEIRHELERLHGKCEVGLKLSWSVENIFDYFVRNDRSLRELRDRVFHDREPSLNDKLQVGAHFESALARERERLTQILVGTLRPVTCDIVYGALRDEKTVCNLTLLVEQARGSEFLDGLRAAAARFDANFAIVTSGPWPPYSFVQLQLQLTASPTAA